MTDAQKKIGPPLAHILETEIDDEISLYDPLTEQVVVLNNTASDVWRLSDGEADLGEIARLLAAAYGVEVDQIRAEVEETIRSFQDQGLLTTEQG
jgi:hypothetical protein